MHTSFRVEGEEYVTRVAFDRRFQGYAGIVHGGFLAMVLDEVMARFVFEKVGPAATARMEVNFRLPAPIDEVIEFRGWITRQRSNRTYEAASTAKLLDGTLLADATCIVVKIKA